MIKFADEHFNEINSGTILINVDNTDDEFTKGAEYEVSQDEEGLFVIDDCGCEELLNQVLAQYFIIKEPETDLEIQLTKARRREAAAVEDLRQTAIFDNSCAFCKHDRSLSFCPHGDKVSCWEWRGPQEAGR